MLGLWKGDRGIDCRPGSLENSESRAGKRSFPSCANKILTGAMAQEERHMAGCQHCAGGVREGFLDKAASELKSESCSRRADREAAQGSAPGGNFLGSGNS